MSLPSGPGSASARLPTYTDTTGLSALRARAANDPQGSLIEVARHLESIFMQMMVSSMRDASLGDSLFDSDQSETYRDLYDRQLGLELSGSQGLGLASVLLRQLGGDPQSLGKGDPGDGQLAGSDGRSAPASNYFTSSVPPIIPLSGRPPSSVAQSGSAPSGQNQSSQGPFGLAYDGPGPLATARDLAPAAGSTLPLALTPADVQLLAGVGTGAAPGVAASNAVDGSARSGPASVPTASGHGAPAASANVGAAQSAPPHRRESPFASPAEFVERLWPHAQAAGKALGAPPGALIAQAALETGWGRSIPSNADGGSSHNLFGIKADSRWEGSRVTHQTAEFRDGVLVKEPHRFRVYGSFEESFSDYARFLQVNPRYNKALDVTSDPGRFFDALQSAGYATDPGYARKLKSVLARVDGPSNG